MISTGQALQTLEEERRQSAAKVRSLLEQLEEAEKEFVALTEKVKAFRDAASGGRPPRSPAPIKHQSFCGSATPRA